MLNKKEREYIRLLTYLTADIRVKLSDSQSLGRYFVRPGSFIAKTVGVPSDEEHPIVIPGWQKNTFFLHLPDFSHRKKYETVRTILGEAGFKDSECLGMQKDILAMIHKGIIPKEIAKTIKKIRE